MSKTYLSQGMCPLCKSENINYETIYDSGDTNYAFYFHSEQEAFNFAARWLATHGCHTDLTEQESLTVIFN